jgi:hypothetical protein
MAGGHEILAWAVRVPIYLGLMLIIFTTPEAFDDGLNLGELLLWGFLWTAMIWVIVGFEGVWMADHGLDGSHWTTRTFWITSWIGIGLFFAFLVAGDVYEFIVFSG